MNLPPGKEAVLGYRGFWAFLEYPYNRPPPDRIDRREDDEMDEDDASWVDQFYTSIFSHRSK
jgi:hypothetical protein